MKRSFLDSVLRGAEALAARDPVGTLPDPDLLRRFAGGRDPAAFAMLVRRHGPLVWGVCRNLLPADADAEDAFQATFLALCRSAASIRRTEALAGWLHGVAYRVALKARRAAARRKKREATAAVPEPSSPVPDAAWDELQAAVHEEVCQLPDKLRLPFVLCGLQGRAQKEAAEVLGWKVGTVSGRLSEARRVLLDRLARRGVPAGVGLGAAVLGGVAGQAAVPASIRVKVLAVAGEPATVSETVLSLARGVTPMYLMRTKLLAAGLVLAGILTTSAGVLSKADAQGQPADPYAEAVRQYADALRVAQTPKDKWEYRFVPVDKPLTAAELRLVLSRADGEGWTYCGSQDLIHQKTDKGTPHMVFKRPAAGGVAADEAPGRKEAAAALLAERYARDLATKMQAEANTQRRRAEAERDQAAAAERAAARNKEVAAKVRAELEKAMNAAATQQADAARAAAAAEKALLDQELTRRREMEARKELEALKAHYEKMIQDLQAQLKAKGVQPPARKADPAGKKPEPQAAGNPFGTPAEMTVHKKFNLKHVDSQEAAEILAKAQLGGGKLQLSAFPGALSVSGPKSVVDEVQTLIENLIDVPAGAKAATATKPEVLVVALKHADAAKVYEQLKKVTGSNAARFNIDTDSNSVILSAPPAVLEALKKVIGTLDRADGPAK